MKHLKYFENNNTIEVGDYVLIRTTKNLISVSDTIEKSKEFVNTHVGVCVGISDHIEPQISVKYYNIPDDIRTYFSMSKDNVGHRNFDLTRVFEYGKTIEELDLKIKIKQYNL